MRVSGSRHIYNFVSSESGITLPLLNWKKVVLTTLGLLKFDLFRACYFKSERNKVMKLIEYFLSIMIRLTNLIVLQWINLLDIKEQNSRHVGQILVWIRVLLIKGFGQDKPGIRLGWSLLICDWISKEAKKIENLFLSKLIIKFENYKDV